MTRSKICTDGFRRQRPAELRRRLPTRAPDLRPRRSGCVDREPASCFSRPTFHRRTRTCTIRQPHERSSITSIAVPRPSMVRTSASARFTSTHRSRSPTTPASAMTLTRALPTTAASAHCPTSRTCSGLEMPNPSATGRSTARAGCDRTDARGAPSAIRSRAPVTPRREIAYRNPLPRAAALRRRSSVVVGLSRRIVSIPGPGQHVPELVGFLDRQVEDQHAVHARPDGAVREPSRRPSARSGCA